MSAPAAVLSPSMPLQREGDRTTEYWEVTVSRKQNAPFTIMPARIFRLQEVLGPVNWAIKSDGKSVQLQGYPVPLAATASTIDTSDVTGLSDLTSGGTYTGVVDGVFTVKISTAAGTDQFKWKYDTLNTPGTLSANVNVTGAAQTLSNGVTITFGATTGHTLGDQWLVFVSGGTVLFTVRLSGIGA